jgi:hypothetical protein
MLLCNEDILEIPNLVYSRSRSLAIKQNLSTLIFINIKWMIENLNRFY